MTTMNIRDAYEASELVCADLMQTLSNTEDSDIRKMILDTLDNAETVRNYLLLEINKLS